MGDLTDNTNERELHEDEDVNEDECDCSNYVFREGVHLPGCPLHSSNLRETDIASEAIKTWAEGYLEGYKAALEQYAWWKDGVQYIGCGVLTLEQALEELKREKGDASDKKTQIKET